MSKTIVLWPEENEVLRQPDVPLWPWPDGSLRQLDGRGKWLLFDHRMNGHDSVVFDCMACVWEHTI